MQNDINIIISMAGQSRRFFDAGFTLPKYMLEINGKSVFELSVCSFDKYFQTNTFIFIIRDTFDTYNFINNICNKLGINNFHIVCLDHDTSGQAETVFLGLRYAKIDVNTPIVIFNIDTFRINFSFPEEIFEYDGYLEVFKGNGLNWSYILPLNENSTLVIKTAEKIEISNFCCTGLYYFRSVSLFNSAFLNFTITSNDLKEKYIAPIYNYLISINFKIHYNLIESGNVVFCGTPEEYNQLIK